MGPNDWCWQQLQTCNLGTSLRGTVITCLQYLRHSLYICRPWKRRVMEFSLKRFHSRIRLFAAASNIQHYDSKWLPLVFCYQASQFLLRKYWWWYQETTSIHALWRGYPLILIRFEIPVWSNVACYIANCGTCYIGPNFGAFNCNIRRGNSVIHIGYY